MRTSSFTILMIVLLMIIIVLALITAGLNLLGMAMQ